MDYEPNTYGDRIADVYDDLYGGLFDTEGAVTFLRELAAGGRVLELGIGTGRIALPLQAEGVEVHGIDSSRAMLDELRAKPDGESVPVTLGDFVEVGVEGQFSVVFVAFNTLFAISNQHDQLRCFENVARRLPPGGAFVVEAFVPDQSRFDRDQRIQTDRVDLERVVLETTRHDRIAQTFHSQQIVISPQGIKMYPVSGRYVWPSEMDLMARLAGLRLKDRFAGWRKEPFTSASAVHVSIYAPQE